MPVFSSGDKRARRVWELRKKRPQQGTLSRTVMRHEPLRGGSAPSPDILWNVRTLFASQKASCKSVA